MAIADPQDAISLLGRLRAASGDRCSSFELVPQVALDLVLQHVPGTRSPDTVAAPWYLLVELTSPADDDLETLLNEALAAAIDSGLALDAVVAQNSTQRDNLWRLRESVPAAQRVVGHSLKHDISVPIAALPQFITAGSHLAHTLAPEGFLVGYGHVGDGNLHFNLSQRPGTDSAAFAAREPALKRAIHDLVASLGGSFSAEHGIGQLKVGELERYAPAAELLLMQRIKHSFDPNGILNPGKVLRAG